MTSTLTTLGCVGRDIDTESEFVHGGRRFTIREEEALIYGHRFYINIISLSLFRSLSGIVRDRL